jgi:FkbM family methyltransferase
VLDTATQPLTVAYVGNFTRPFCTEVHVQGSLEELGHRVVPVQENTLDWRGLPDLVRLEGAHMVLWTRTWEVDRDASLWALAELAERGVPTVSYHLDRWWGLEREYQVGTEPFFRTAMVFSPDDQPERWAEAGVNHRWLPPGVYGPECRPSRLNRRLFPQDVVFVGTHPYPHPAWRGYRTELLDRLEGRYGRRFTRWPKQRPVRGRQLGELYATAKVVIGDSCLAGEPRGYWSDRVPETLGRGGLLVHPHDPVLADWYPDLPTYPLGDFDALLELTDALLARTDEERRRLVEKNRSLVLARDTYAHRMATVLEVVGRDLGVPEVERSVAHHVGEVQTRHRRHRNLRATFTLAEGSSDAVAVREVWEDDTYGVDQGQLLNRTVVDVGANVGAFSVLAAQLGAAQVHAWEPHPDTRLRLVANLEANRVAPKVTVHPAALAAKEGEVWLGGIGGGATTTRADGEHLVVAESINDEWAALGPIGLAKIDCEGAEYDLLDALEPALLSNVEHLVMEFHGPGMPHLRHLDDDGLHERRWGAMVAKLAALGRVRVFGRPAVGGVLWWDRY